MLFFKQIMNIFKFQPIAILCSVTLLISCATPPIITPTGTPLVIATETPRLPTPTLPSVTVTLPAPTPPTPVSNILPPESNLHQAACKDIANIGHNAFTLQKVYNNYTVV